MADQTITSTITDPDAVKRAAEAADLEAADDAQLTIDDAGLGFLAGLLDLAVIRRQAGQILRLAAAATGGEWWQDPAVDPGMVWALGSDDEGRMVPTIAEANEHNTPLIAWCQPGAAQLARTVLLLAGEVDRLRRINDAHDRESSLIKAMREDIEVQHACSADSQQRAAHAVAEADRARTQLTDLRDAVDGYLAVAGDGTGQERAFYGQVLRQTRNGLSHKDALVRARASRDQARAAEAGRARRDGDR